MFVMHIKIKCFSMNIDQAESLFFLIKIAIKSVASFLFYSKLSAFYSYLLWIQNSNGSTGLNYLLFVDIFWCDGSFRFHFLMCLYFIFDSVRKSLFLFQYCWKLLTSSCYHKDHKGILFRKKLTKAPTTSLMINSS